MPQKRSSELVLVADPMCSWCYAFGPELDGVLAETDLPIRVVMGGLFVGDRSLPLDDGLRRYLSQTWARVSHLSGRPIATNFLDRDDWIYDTERACRAVVAMREWAPERSLAFFDRLQQAFYAEAIDIASIEPYEDLVDGFDLSPGQFVEVMESPRLIDLTRADFAEAARHGARGFPTLLLDTGAERIIVAAGYVRAAKVLRTLAVLDG